MRVYRVSSTVNKVENDSPECAKEEANAEQEIPAQRDLF